MNELITLSIYIHTNTPILQYMCCTILLFLFSMCSASLLLVVPLGGPALAPPPDLLGASEVVVVLVQKALALRVEVVLCRKELLHRPRAKGESTRDALCLVPSVQPVPALSVHQVRWMHATIAQNVCEQNAQTQIEIEIVEIDR